MQCTHFCHSIHFAESTAPVAADAAAVAAADAADAAEGGDADNVDEGATDANFAPTLFFFAPSLVCVPEPHDPRLMYLH